MPQVLLSWIQCNFIKYLFSFHAFVPVCIPPFCVPFPSLCLAPAATVLSPPFLWNSASQCHNALGPHTIRLASQARLTHQSLQPSHACTQKRTWKVQHFFTPSATVADREAVYTEGLGEVLFAVADSLQHHLSNQNKNKRAMFFIQNTHTCSLVVTHDISIHTVCSDTVWFSKA